MTAINRDATQATRHQALADAEGISYLYFSAMRWARGSAKAFLTAYDKGELGCRGAD